MKQRTVQSIVSGYKTSDGAGVKLARALGSQTAHQFGPFLMLGAFDLNNTKEEVERAFMPIRFGTFIGDGNY